MISLNRLLSFRFLVGLALALSVSIPSYVGAQLPDSIRPENSLRGVAAPNSAPEGQIEVTIRTIDGLLVWADVAQKLAESLVLDAPTLERMFPTGSLDLRSPTTMLALLGIDLALGDAVSIKMLYDEQGQPALRFRCDRKTLGMMAPRKKLNQPAGIQIDDDWKERSTRKPIVLCFHGLKSSPAKFDDFRGFMRDAGFGTAAVTYDDRQSITHSAGQIDKIVSQLFAGQDLPKLILVGHSMGGLVAREWTENPAFNSQLVVSLITVATPHRGSNWASLPPLLDLFADGSLDSQDLVDVLLHQPSAPGMRELAPESKFLTEMNARPRKPAVRYTTIIGTGSPVSETDVARLRETLQRLDQEGSMLRLIRPRIQPLLQSFNELARGKGDGVVAKDRASIQGVDDIVVVELSHIDMMSPAKAASKQPVWEAILKRGEAR